MLKSIKKIELKDLLKSTADALCKAESTIFKRSDALLKSSNELVKQWDLNRNALSFILSPVNFHRAVNETTSENTTRKWFTTIEEPTDTSDTILAEDLKIRVKTSLQDSKENYARITNQWRLVINVPDHQINDKAM